MCIFLVERLPIRTDWEWFYQEMILMKESHLATFHAVFICSNIVEHLTCLKHIAIRHTHDYRQQ